MMSKRTPSPPRSIDADGLDTMLLHIAATRPRNAAELSQRIARPQGAVHEDVKSLIDSGAAYVHDGALHATAATRILEAASTEALRDLHGQVLAEFDSGAALRTPPLIALAESGCTDERLLRLLVRIVSESPDDASAAAALHTVAESCGRSATDIRLLQAADAALHGRPERVLSLVDDVLSSGSASQIHRASLLAAGAHLQENRLGRSLALFAHAGDTQPSPEAAWAVVAALGHGDIPRAEKWRMLVPDEAVTSYAAGLSELASGLMDSVSDRDGAALDILARSVSALTPIGADLALPESPAALAAFVAIGRGEPGIAEVILGRALDAELGGPAGRQRHVLLMSWVLMMQGRIDHAEQRLKDIGQEKQLCARDRFLYWALAAGLARRNSDLALMRDAWRELRGHSFGMTVTLYDLLPLGEMMVVAARLHDTDRVRSLVADARELLARLGNPVTWSAPFHWHGVQAAFQSEDPLALVPHANALAASEGESSYAATLARAGATWLAVLRREADFPSVEQSARALARHGHVWDAARLAGQAALQHPERDDALSMMQLAREINKDQLRPARSAPSSSALTARELDVAQLVLEGQGYRAIGEQLFISPKTVEHHVARMRSRLGAVSRGDLLEKLHDIVSALES